MRASRKPIEPPPLSNGRYKVYEYYGYRVDQVVPITNCSGKYSTVKGTWKFKYVTCAADGTPLELTVYGGTKNYKQFKAVPFERLEPPKKRRGKRVVSSPA